MIEVEITTALLLYLGSILVIFFAIWVIFHMKERKKTAYTPPSELLSCEYCHYPYLAQIGEKLSKCPQCRSMNRQVHQGKRH